MESTWKLIVFVIFTTFFMYGCASSVNYKLDSKLYKGTPTQKVLLVNVFKDVRPESEHQGEAGVLAGQINTGDKNFKPHVGGQVSQMLVKHLTSTGMFRKVLLEEVPSDLDTNIEEMTKLSDRGVDLAITGQLKHFYGYQSGSAGAAGALFGAMGVLTEAIANPKTVRGGAEYTDVKIIDVKNQHVLWQGNIQHDFEQKITFYDGPVAYALKGLKETNDKFTHRLDQVLQSNEVLAKQ
jgi:curli biogenesis system outer membrane secretion channel CsgG